MVRKAMISLFGVIFAFDQRLQGMVGMMIVFVMTVIQAKGL